MSLTLVVVLLGVTMVHEVTALRESADTVDAVSLALAVQDAVQEAQRERGLSNGLLGGDVQLRQTVVEQRGATDRAIRALGDSAASAVPGAAQVRSAVEQFAALGDTRTQIDAGRTTRQAAFQFYTDGIAALNRLSLGLDQADDPEVRHGLQALYALGQAKEQTAKERGFLNGVFAAGGFGPGEYVQFLDIRAAKVADLTAFARDSTGHQQAMLDAVLRGENALKARESENIAIASSTGSLVRSVDPSIWWTQMTAVIDEQRMVQQAVGEDVRQRAAELRQEAALTLAGFLLAALIAIGVEILMVVGSVRAIVRPLGKLAAEADDVANRRLPDVIAAWRASGDTRPEPPEPVRTPPGASAEIAAVAGALDNVQTTAFELASEQALVRRNTTESMANLARRNQNLVRRQLGLISEFERDEMDPKALSNLFELDHLATRMRRNAESLLVLVGEASPRRWTHAIALTDVIRAGMSEVDDYRRVVLRRVDGVAVTGAVVSELAHMLAELIENGLAFSPPDLEVEIYGRKLPHGYLLAVVDHGVGMPTEQLNEANARLCGASDFIVAPTRYLGHYVVGRLARRLGIEVELNVSPVSGIVARLLLPLELLVEPKDKRGPVGAPPSADQQDRLRDDRPVDKVAVRGTRIGGGGPADHSATAGQRSGAVASSARTADSPSASTASRALPTGTGLGASRAHARVPEVEASTNGARTTGVSGVYEIGAWPPNRSVPAYSRTGTATPDQSSGRSPETSLSPEASRSDSMAAQRTRNGLVKRNKRSGATVCPAPITLSPPTAPVTERSPAEIRSMLSAFRAGHERGAPTPAPGLPTDGPGSLQTGTFATDRAQPASATTAEEIL